MERIEMNEWKCCSPLISQTELEGVQCEQEDLLLLLSEQDSRLQRYRSHLTLRGVTPPPGEEDHVGADSDKEDFDESSLQ